MEQPLSCDPGLAVLSLMAEYHDCARAGLPASRDRATRTRLIEELLLPNRFSHDGLHPVPVQMDLHRPARIASQAGEMEGATLSVSIDQVRVALTPEGRGRFKLRTHVVLAIQTGWPKVWWRFVGKVTRVGPQRRTLTVRLLHTMGCTSSSSPSLAATGNPGPPGRGVVVPLASARAGALHS